MKKRKIDLYSLTTMIVILSIVMIIFGIVFILLGFFFPIDLQEDTNIWMNMQYYDAGLIKYKWLIDHAPITTELNIAFERLVSLIFTGITFVSVGLLLLVIMSLLKIRGIWREKKNESE